jgi:hypothetical protein
MKKGSAVPNKNKIENINNRFKRALSNYIPILKNIDDIDEKNPGKYKEEYPKGWNDPPSTNEFVSRYSPQWVWENRIRLVAEMIYIRDYF